MACSRLRQTLASLVASAGKLRLRQTLASLVASAGKFRLRPALHDWPSNGGARPPSQAIASVVATAVVG